MSEEQPSISEIREEVRNAIFWIVFRGLAAEVEGQKKLEEVSKTSAIHFAEFGVRTKLLTPDEGNEWLDAIHGRVAIGKVSMKYMGTSHKEEGTK